MTDQIENPNPNPEPTPTPTSVLTPPDENNPIELTEPTVPVVPESADAYAVDIEGFDFDAFKGIEENKTFLDDAHKAGFTNEQLGFVLGKYNEIIPQLLQANAALDTDACKAAMTEAWGADTQANFGFAHAAAQSAIQNGILTAEEINSPEFGNNPLVLKMAAYFGSQLQEDNPRFNTQQNSGESIQSLMQSEAYLNDKHVDHARVFAEVQKWYEKNY